jgi:hypothetical protein
MQKLSGYHSWNTNGERRLIKMIMIMTYQNHQSDLRSLSKIYNLQSPI